MNDAGLGRGSEGLAGQARAAALGGDWSTAERCWRTAVAASPQTFDWRREWAKALSRLERYPEAASVYAEMRSRWPGKTAGWTGPAEIAAAQGDWAAAERRWRECITAFGQQSTAGWWQSLAKALLKQNLHAQANEICREAQTRFPSEPGCWETAARVAAAQGAVARCGRAWEAAAARSAADRCGRCYQSGMAAFARAARFVDAERLLEQWKGRATGGCAALLRAEIELLEAQGDFRSALAMVSSPALAPAAGEAFLPAHIARIAFEAGFAPVRTIELLTRWLSLEAAVAAVDESYRDNRRGDDVAEELERRKARPPKSTQAEIRALARGALRTFLNNRTYRRFRSLFQEASVAEIATDRQLRGLRRIAIRLFPASPLRCLLDQYFESGAIEPEAAAYASGWRVCLPRPGDSIAASLGALSHERLICATKVRNEADVLPHFFSHHMALGVKRFIVVDNGSSDGLAEVCEHVRDAEITVIEAPYSYAGNRAGMAWINEILEAGLCDWLLHLDADERFVFPDCEHRSLPDLLDHFDRRGETAAPAFMLDMYDESHRRGELPSGDIEDHELFFARHSILKALRAPYLEVWGGIRFAERDRHPYVKAPLVRASAGIRYYNAHYVSDCVPAQTTGVLLHYKVHRDRDLVGLAPKAVMAHPRVRDRTIGPIVRHVEFAARSLSNYASGPFHTRLAGSPQLVRLGYMAADREWRAQGAGPAPASLGHGGEEPRSRGKRVEHLVLHQAGFESLLDALADAARAGRREEVRRLLRTNMPRIGSRPVGLGVLLLCADALGLAESGERIAGALRHLARTLSPEDRVHVGAVLKRRALSASPAALSLADAVGASDPQSMSLAAPCAAFDCDRGGDSRDWAS